MCIIPIYLYGIHCSPEVGDGALFHYTGFDSFIKILESMTLRSSPLCNMNDLNEADLSGLDWNDDFLRMHQAQNYVRTKCSVISFSQNYEVDSVCREGSNHPALWAHYADDSRGACIVLDREALLEVNRDCLQYLFYKLEDVDYTWNQAPSLEVNRERFSTVSEFVQKNYRELFYKKDIDWFNEREVRLFLETPQIYLNIREVEYMSSRMACMLSLSIPLYSSSIGAIFKNPFFASALRVNHGIVEFMSFSISSFFPRLVA